VSVNPSICTTPELTFMAFASFLALDNRADPYVMWIEPRLPVYIRNQYAQSVTQSNVANSRPIWSKGFGQLKKQNIHAHSSMASLCGFTFHFIPLALYIYTVYIYTYIHTLYLLNYYKPFFHRLHGENQIVGVADSGIDYKHCFFKDSNYNMVVKVSGYSSCSLTEQTDGCSTSLTNTFLLLSLHFSIILAGRNSVLKSQPPQNCPILSICRHR
jgi:hypothetical protein